MLALGAVAAMQAGLCVRHATAYGLPLMDRHASDQGGGGEEGDDKSKLHVASLINRGKNTTMNGNQTYWLCRARGAATEGPFTLGQLTSMYGKGAVTAEALACEVGSDAWQDLAELIEGGGKTAFIHSRKIHTGGSNCLEICLFLIGLLLLLLSLFCLPALLLTALVFLFGFAFLALSTFVRAKHRVEHFCSDCGNTVAVTSRQCPSCKAELDLPPDDWKKQSVKLFWLLFYAVLFFVLGLMIVTMLAPKS